jgi:hypothetical protein
MPSLKTLPTYQYSYFNANSRKRHLYQQSPSIETPCDETGSFKRTWTSLIVDPGMLKTKPDQINKFGTTLLGNAYNRHRGIETGEPSGTLFQKDPYIMDQKTGFVADQILHYVPGSSIITDPFCSAPQTMDLEAGLQLPNPDDLNRVKDIKKITIKNDTQNNALTAMYDAASKRKTTSTNDTSMTLPDENKPDGDTGASGQTGIPLIGPPISSDSDEILQPSDKDNTHENITPTGQDEIDWDIPSEYDGQGGRITQQDEEDFETGDRKKRNDTHSDFFGSPI